ncbi:MAG: hypothetical protein JNM86_04170 [Phycisphaerae bacterium]|nr:hypothetical protein [Phycisphaerae bacterium]
MRATADEGGKLADRVYVAENSVSAMLRHPESREVCLERQKNARFERQCAKVLAAGATASVATVLPVLTGYGAMHKARTRGVRKKKARR